MINLQNLPKNPIETISLTAIIDTALCIGAGGSDGSLADKPIVRNAEGKLLIPASQLKGRLRHECEKIATALGWQIFPAPKAEILCPNEDQVHEEFQQQYQLENYKGYHCFVSQIFGNPILPSRIIVSDLICDMQKEDLPEVIRPGVTINRRRRTSEEKKLYFLETSLPNSKLEFTGAIQLLPDCPEYTKPLILAALHHIYALGGSKSAGLGWLTWEGLENLQTNNTNWQLLLPNKTICNELS
ncbi:CRISPR-associated protein Csm3 [Anabaena sp. FACHB-1237]|uniref:RAMP superfamily CRISPR-associated protein n=1 Tax=Anabaena sp. FACHB-1237 TaxID=2692769 RepID=UPI001680ED47|nr:RAMP superfamily CRISPR-associated protein [Anabaena sp. FACHB-1237]MBD2137685.1 CRISPR-associated protein Csm3 [Anabaena sp. FACHB-1237]